MPWACGEKYYYSLDTDKNKKQADDPGTLVVDNLRTRERIRCDLWKDEINNLLIFSGLFSAVVTAFIIESYKGLREDPNETTAFLLSQLVAIMNSTAGGTAAPTSFPTSIQTSFSPTSTTTRVNIFWFLSLVFSITTAMIGIVSLQWVREHQRPVQGLTSRFEGALLHMHAEALDRYYVPQIISTLPVLLLVGLLLFLIGLIDFLWNIDRIVASPVLATVSLTVLFLLVSTCFPGFQPLPLHRSHREPGSCPRAPCPYKSPQSWSFLCCVAYFKRLFKALANSHFKSFTSCFGADLGDSWIKHGLFWLRQRDIDGVTSNIRRLDSVSRNRLSGPPEDKSEESWDSYEIERLDHEDLLKSLCNPGRHYSPLYDGVHAHLQVKTSIPASSSDTLELCRSFNDVLSLTYGSEGFNSELLAVYLHGLLPPNKTYTFSQDAVLAACPEAAVFLDHTRFLFFLYGTDLFRFPPLTLYHIEMCTRLSEWIFRSEHLLGTDIPGKSGIFFAQQYILKDHYREIRNIEGADCEKIVEGLLELLTSLFIYASDNNPSALVEDSQKSIFTSTYVTMVLDDVTSIMDSVPHSPATTQHINSHLESIAMRVRERRHTAGGDYLFWTASLYISLLLKNCDKERYDSAGVVRELQEYKRFLDAQSPGSRHQYVEALRNCMLTPYLFDRFSWDFLDQAEAEQTGASQSRDIAGDEAADESGITSNDNPHASDHSAPSHDTERSQNGPAYLESSNPSSPSPTAHIAINVVDSPLPSTTGILSSNVPPNVRVDTT